jgi:hypothetical protein
MRRLMHSVTRARVENAQSGRVSYEYAIQGTWDGQPIGLVNARHLSRIYPSGTPRGTRYLQFPGSEEKHLVLHAVNVLAPEFEANSDGLRVFSNRMREDAYVAPSRLISSGSGGAELARDVIGRVRHTVGPPKRIRQIPYGPIAKQITPRQREMIDFIKANPGIFTGANRGPMRRKAGFFNRLGALMMHPVVRVVGALVALAIFYLLFSRQINMLFGALSHVGRR